MDPGRPGRKPLEASAGLGYNHIVKLSTLLFICAAQVWAGSGARIAGPEGGPPAAVPSLRLEGLRVEGDRLYLGETRFEPLGRGATALVFPHPRLPGAVIKITDESLWAALPELARQRAESDAQVTQLLAQAGAGPRLLGASAHFGRPALVKGLIDGQTLAALLLQGRLGRAPYALSLELLRRMAEARIDVEDMDPANVMVGLAVPDPSLRAYHLDGHAALPVHPYTSSESLFDSLSVRLKGGLEYFHWERFQRRATLEEILNTGDRGEHSPANPRGAP